MFAEIENQGFLDSAPGQSKKRFSWRFIGFLAFVLVAAAIICATMLINPQNIERDDSDDESFCGTHPKNNFTVVSSSQNSTHYELVLEYKGKKKFYLDEYNTYVKKVKVSFGYTAVDQLSISINDADQSLESIYDEVPYRNKTSYIPYSEGKFKINAVQKPFSFQVLRKDTNEILFDTNGTDLILSKYYHDIWTTVDTEHIYGWGGSSSELDLGYNGTYRLWDEEGVYGGHPYYLFKTKKGTYNLVLLKSSSAIQVTLRQSRKQQRIQVFGGKLNLYIFAGNSNPETVIQKYHTFVGTWNIPPFWSLGWHQSRLGYKDLTILKDVVEKYDSYNLPLDAIWSDIDYMVDNSVFTIDENRFPHTEFKKFLEESGKKWVAALNPAISIRNYSAYNLGISSDIFVKNDKGKPYIGELPTGKVVFPDFLKPETELYWAENLDQLHELVPFSGLWMSTSEVSNFCGSHCKSNNSNSSFDIIFSLASPGGPIVPKSFPLDLKYYSGSNSTIQEYYIHQLYAGVISYRTQVYLKTISNLTFSLTRSSFPGSGKFASNWLGDSPATWDSLRSSVRAIMQMNLNGVPHTGSDICGTTGETTPELCARWTQLGSLFPFARNHQHSASKGHEPWSFDDELLTATRVSLQLRYSLLKYYYSLFIEKGGAGTIFRPLFFEFPSDNNLFDSKKQITNEQFLIGTGLMVAPVLYPGKTSVHVYLPKAVWYDFYTGERLFDATNSPKTVEILNSLTSPVPLFIRGETIIPKQDITDVKSTVDLNKSVELIIALGSKNSAEGIVLGISNYSDESEVSEKCILDNCFLKIQATHKNNYLNITTNADGKKADKNLALYIENIIIYGLQTSPSLCANASSYDRHGQTIHVNSSCTNHSVKLTFKHLPLKHQDEIKIQLE